MHIERAVRRIIMCCFIITILTAIMATPKFAYEITFDNTASVAKFPASLQSLEDEAFFGTSFKILIFDNQLKEIGEKAFFDNAYLTDGYLPQSVNTIGASAFPYGIQLHGIADSYVQKWAEENSYDFVVDDIWNPRLLQYRENTEYLVVFYCFVLLSNKQKINMFRRRIEVFIKSMRPQDRPELYPINYRFP